MNHFHPALFKYIMEESLSSNYKHSIFYGANALKLGKFYHAI